MYNMYFFFSGFFSLTVILRLIHVAYINSFISFYCLVLLCCIGISLSIHLLMDIWVVSSFWLSEIELLWHLCYKALCVYKCFYFFWVNVQEWNVCVYVCSTHPPPPTPHLPNTVYFTEPRDGEKVYESLGCQA